MESARSESTKYERIRKIGAGSYGVVFKCVNRQTGLIVAIKRFSENDSDPAVRKIAMREVRMLRQLKHPNLIDLIEVFRRKRILHLVFDYCELTVLDVIDKHGANCPLNLIKKIIWQLVSAVSHCHAQNCIHRDIKPENILIKQSGIVKLCDFGFARYLKSSASSASCGGGGGSSGSTNSSSRTAAIAYTNKQGRFERDAKLLGVVVPPLPHHRQTNGAAAAAAAASACERPENSQQQQLTINDEKENNNSAAYLASERQALTEYVATRWYRAPELLVGDIYYDFKIDIWAIGCVTAELMRGEPLWPGKTDLHQLCIIMGSLGALTASQSHTLLTAGQYDQASIERLLQQTRVSDPLERRMPAARVGQAGVNFVLACLRMDPTRRPQGDELLEHAYIKSSTMSQFVRDATGRAAGAPRDASSHRIMPARAIQADFPMACHSNSQAILRAANQHQQQPPASKRLVLAPGSTSPSGCSSSTSANTSGTNPDLPTPPAAAVAAAGANRYGPAHSLVPVPVRHFRQQKQAEPGELVLSMSREQHNVEASNKATSSRRRRPRADNNSSKPVAAQASQSRLRNAQYDTTTTTTVGALPSTTVTTPVGNTRRRSSRYAPTQLGDQQRPRLSSSQSNLPSAAHSQQQQQHQVKSTSQRLMMAQQANNPSHLVVLAEPTKRDRQRRTNLATTSPRKQQQQQRVVDVMSARGKDRAPLVAATSMSHGVQPKQAPPV